MATVGMTCEGITEETHNAGKDNKDTENKSSERHATENQDAIMDNKDTGGETSEAIVSEKTLDDMEIQDMVTFFEKRKKEFPDLEDIEEIRVMIGEILKQETDRGTEESNEHDNEEKQMTAKSMEEALAKDKLMKDELGVLYDLVIPFLETGINKDIWEPLLTLYGNNIDPEARKDDLLLGECPIVVAGETSAGKSSLLNLLLGADVLPHSLLSTTSTICRLHNIRPDQPRRFKISTNNGAPITRTIDEHTIDKLKEEISGRPPKRVQQMESQIEKEVDIYWPIPMLGEYTQITIVDTPGVGESDEMTEKLFRFLPKAVALIYVIDSRNAGGIQEDRLVKIMEEQKQQLQKSHQSFDNSCVLFVCNKWDIVKERDQREEGTEEKVWNETLEKLQKYFPGFKKDNVFKFSVTEAQRYQKHGMGHTKQFQKLLKGLEKLVPQSLQNKVKKHHSWIDNLLGEIQQIVTTRINRAMDSDEEKERVQQSVYRRLNTLSTEAEQVKADLRKTAESACKSIAKKLHEYLLSAEFRTELMTWTDSEAPDVEAGDFEVTRLNATKKIIKKVQNKIHAWEQTEKYLRKGVEELTTRFNEKCQLLSKEAIQLDKVLRGEPNLSETQLDRRSLRMNNTVLFTKSEKIILVVSAPLWVPIVTAASLLFLPIGVGMLIRESFRVNSMKKEYERNKVKFMREWTEEFIKTELTEDNIHDIIFKAYFKFFEDQICELCDKTIPRIIEADRHQIQRIRDDRRTATEILREFHPIQKTLKDITGKTRLYSLRHYDVDLVDVNSITLEREIGVGNFSTVYKAALKKPDVAQTAVAIKVLKQAMKGGELYTQLYEVECLRTLKHKNIIELLGVSMADHLPGFGTGGTSIPFSDARLMLLLELCDASLQTIVFDRNERKCGSHKEGSQQRTEALSFFKKIATGISDGLAYMHAKNYAHRDLKLSNVLLKNNEAKLCDLGFSRAGMDITGTFVGTMSHMSPEMLSNKRYTYKTDIFSLGVVLWELWYGRHVYSEPEYESFGINVLLDAIKNGQKPRCTFQYAMPKTLQKVLEQCWDLDPDKRPEASHVAVVLNTL